MVLKSANIFHLLVSPRRTLRHHECLSACWYLTPLQLRLVDDECSQKRGNGSCFWSQVCGEGAAHERVNRVYTTVRLYGLVVLLQTKSPSLQHHIYCRCALSATAALVRRLTVYSRTTVVSPRFGFRRPRAGLATVSSSYLGLATQNTLNVRNTICK